MSDVLRVKWTIGVQSPPQPLLYCRRCKGTRNFTSSGRIRLNANGKRIDAWLIYRCTSCDSTWNRPVLERRPLRSIDPLVLAALQANEPTLARNLALDVEDLKRRVGTVEAFDGVVVVKDTQSWHTGPVRGVEILLVVPHPVVHRLDRLLAAELQLSRSQVHAMAASGALVVTPGKPRALRSAIRDGMRLTILIAPNDPEIVEAAMRNGPAP